MTPFLLPDALFQRRGQQFVLAIGLFPGKFKLRTPEMPVTGQFGIDGPVQLPVTDDMVVYGNYSELVTEQVEYILDHNPELEAIAFANDNMAKAGYRVCAARDLLVGYDIDHAKTMEPPLTSVSHSSFQFSYQALQNALMLCQGKKPQSCRMSAIFHQRSSCGCQLHTGFTTLRHISME